MAVDDGFVDLVGDVIYTSDRGVSTAALRARFPDVHPRRFAEAVERLIESGIPVGSSPARGYFLCRTPEDLREARGEIISRIKSLRRRLDGLDRAARALIEDTLTLFPQEDENIDDEGLDSLTAYREGSAYG